MMQMNAGGHPLSIAAIKWTILQQGVREPTGVAIPARGTRAIPGVVPRLVFLVEMDAGGPVNYVAGSRQPALQISF